MDASRRWMLWGGLLAGTVAAAIYPTQQASEASVEVAAHTRRPLPGNTQASAAASDVMQPVAQHTQVSQMTKTDASAPTTSPDPFAAVAWDAAPQPVQAPVVLPAPSLPVGPVEPQEPAMPYRFVGRMMEEGSQPVIYLARGQDSLVVHVGDKLDNDYKLVAADEHKLVIEYLPLGRRHDLAIDTQ